MRFSFISDSIFIMVNLRLKPKFVNQIFNISHRQAAGYSGDFAAKQAGLRRFEDEKTTPELYQAPRKV